MSSSLNNSSICTYSCWESNQGNQGYSGNQNNAIHGRRPDMENRHTQQRIQSNGTIPKSRETVYKVCMKSSAWGLGIKRSLFTAFCE